MKTFYVYIGICTFVFFILLRIYKQKVLRDRKVKKGSSNLIFLLFVPVILYLTKYINIDINEKTIVIPEYIKPTTVSYTGSVISSI